ncbi:MAG TPA: molecular chaperone DjiA [Alphaproteobacteria bacterium]|jgi:DnaJ like chaperone protein|nr:MAG: Co-chaperone protein DjlA [Alphaproteobacteria bacterium MarineAlpha9_Bin6]PPR37252.1 MAG: Co-chaperone protein DjlA [Alphaproteobacteria bacterium MarineAlpha9_Bin5]HIA22078.1 molecular chaperone DjiA [Alphaproteobacteria bacterium]HIB19463.1 molecular chaperone DjiA [Alphaproteobacteria bacterium]HIB57582.1 molecular chaperone DjiA [Alphaproteobacteria bacterium]
MSVWGKILGASAGYALGGPLGALAGVVAGHYIGRFRAEAEAAERSDGVSHGSEPERTQRQLSFAIAVIALAAKLAKADGVVTHNEIATFKRIFRIPIAEIKDVRAIFNEARETADNFEPYAQQVASMFHSNLAVLEELLDALFAIAKADGVLHRSELDYLRSVARIFGFNDTEFDRISAGHAPDPSSDPYLILGVSQDVSDQELKSHHRNLVLQHHPDKLIAQGMPPEFIDQANQKLGLINSAYDQVRKQRAGN